MKKIIIKIVFILLIFLIAIFAMFNKKETTLKKVKVADTTLTSRTYAN